MREIFDLYLQLGFLLPVVDELARRGWRNKAWVTKAGQPKGDRTFDKGSLHALLTNTLYIGQIKHKGQRYPGEYEPIVDEETFRKVQQLLQYNNRTGGAEVRNKPSPAGLICSPEPKMVIIQNLRSSENFETLVAQIMNLLHLAPDIQEEILHLPQSCPARIPFMRRCCGPLRRR